MAAHLYQWNTFVFALTVVLTTVTLAVAGLWCTRRYVLPRLQYHDGLNDAVSGTVQAIGIFYGVTVGLIAIGVWENYSKATDITSRESATVFALYLVVNKFPDPHRNTLNTELTRYLESIINVAWPVQKTSGKKPSAEWQYLGSFHTALARLNPESEADKIRYAVALELYSRLVELRRQRGDIASGGLSPTMWTVIFIGAAISICIAYFFDIKDGKLHATLVILMSCFLGIVIFMIALNDKPFLGKSAIAATSYEEVLSTIQKMRGQASER